MWSVTVAEGNRFRFPFGSVPSSNYFKDCQVERPDFPIPSHFSPRPTCVFSEFRKIV